MTKDAPDCNDSLDSAEKKVVENIKLAISVIEELEKLENCDQETASDLSLRFIQNIQDIATLLAPLLHQQNVPEPIQATPYLARSRADIAAQKLAVIRKQVAELSQLRPGGAAGPEASDVNMTEADKQS